MRLVDIIPLTKIPHTQSQILSYFSDTEIKTGSLVEIPLGKRKENGIVLGSREIDKMQIKKADFSLKKINKVILSEPILTPRQIELALYLSRYYLASPGIFLKMMLPRRPSPTTQAIGEQAKKIVTSKIQKLILAPTIASAKNIAAANKKAILWHSDLTVKQKDEIWQKIKSGQTQTIVGTRSAAFLPFCNLKEIIIEDEKNSGHKSWDAWPHYESIVVAKKLAEIFNAKLTVSDKFRAVGLHEIKSTIIDMREELKQKNFSVFSFALEEKIKETLAQKKQIILFANRRGAANFILCRDCGFVINCTNCDSPMAFHFINQKPQLFCHHCGKQENPPGRCPSCQSQRIKTIGSGTQKIESEAKRFFPSCKIARLDNDIAPKPINQQKIIQSFTAKEIDILITTQIIFSWEKELKPINLYLVALLSADTLINLPDYRSGERTWQIIFNLKKLLNKKTGQLFIQTYNPNNEAIKYAAQNNWKAFWQEELETREALNYPPYAQIVKLTLRHRDGKKVGQEAKILSAKLQQTNKDEKINISPALPAFIPREQGKFVWNIIIKFPISNFQFPINNEFLQKRNSLLQYVPQNWEIDVDPENLL